MRQAYGTHKRHSRCIAPKKWRGSVHAYSNLKCRCPRCREAWRVYYKARREAAKSAYQGGKVQVISEHAA